MSAALDLMAALVLEDGSRWGDAAAEFQWEDARAVLEQEPAIPYHFLIRVRGGSKTNDLGGLEVAACTRKVADLSADPLCPGFEIQDPTSDSLGYDGTWRI